MKFHSISDSLVDDDWLQMRKLATKLQFFHKKVLQDPRVPHADENYIVYIIGDNPTYEEKRHRVLLSGRERWDGSRATAREQRGPGDGIKVFAKTFEDIGDAFAFALMKEGWVVVDPSTG